MTLITIKARDAHGDFHTFRGEDLQFRLNTMENGTEICEIFSYLENGDGDIVRHNAGYVRNPSWIKIAEDRPAVPSEKFEVPDLRGKISAPAPDPAPKEPELDPFTQKALQGHAPGSVTIKEPAESKPAEKKPARTRKKPPADPIKGEAPIASAPVLTEGEPDPRATPQDKIPEQDQSPNGDVPCETCHGKGTVPDPESDDPLDTTMCPDC